jgi:hypothetical protein
MYCFNMVHVYLCCVITFTMVCMHDVSLTDLPCVSVYVYMLHAINAEVWEAESLCPLGVLDPPSTHHLSAAAAKGKTGGGEGGGGVISLLVEDGRLFSASHGVNISEYLL